MTRVVGIKDQYIIKKTDSIKIVLEKIYINNGFPLIVLNNDKTLFGIISNGDIAKYLSLNPLKEINSICAFDIANQHPITGNISDKFETIEAYLSQDKIRLLPLLDNNRFVKKIITRENPCLQIGNYIISDETKPYLIAEIGVNHNGSLDEAFFLIESAANAGCNAVKFQFRSKNLYNSELLNTYDLGTQYIISEIERTYLNINDLHKCFLKSQDLELDFIVTPFDENALEKLTNSNIKCSALKIASCDLTNLDLIKSCISKDLPLILSTGMSYEREIIRASLLLKSFFAEHAFLHCNSTYPAPLEDANLKYIERLKGFTKTIIGYSSHDGNLLTPLTSISCGARIIEFHITRNKNSIGTDHRASLEVADIKELVSASANIFSSLGNNMPRVPSQGELANKISLGKSYALKKSKKKGYVILKEDLILISPGSGFNPESQDKLIGKKLLNDVSLNQIIKDNDINKFQFNEINSLEKSLVNLESFGYKVGIPVRYHDFKFLNSAFKTNMIEFHMSDRDISLNPNDFLDQKYNIDLIVHAVEQFEDGFIFDFGSNDKSIVNRSHNEIYRLCEHINKLRKFFKDKKQIPVVINLGGFSEYKFMEEITYRSCLERVCLELDKINNRYAEFKFIPQTMPPFPWHQGGRSFHNVLTNIEKIKDFIQISNNDICLDISHSALSCIHYKQDLMSLINCLKNRIFHIHLADAKGSNSEGLEIGSGSLDFKEIHRRLFSKQNSYYLIPEIWQGHLNNGKPFAQSIIRFYDLIS